MSPSADQAGALGISQTVSEALLRDGEEIILAVKPSGWYVLLVSWPVLVAAATVAVASGVLGFSGPRQVVPFACAAAACLRVVLACCQWVGLLYVLTNRRVMRVRGILRSDACWCELAKIAEVAISAGPLEGLLGLASLLFLEAGGRCSQVCWTNLARPAEVQQAVRSAIRHLP